MRYFYLQSFVFISRMVLYLYSGQCSKCKKLQSAITSKLGKTESWFFCTALLLNEIYLPTKCHVDAYDRRADRQMDGRVKRRLYNYPSGSIIQPHTYDLSYLYKRRIFKFFETRTMPAQHYLNHPKSKIQNFQRYIFSKRTGFRGS
jgi:hypothetical protein